MLPDLAPLPVVLGPLLLVIGLLFGLRPFLSEEQPWRFLVAALVAAIVGRYLCWRIGTLPRPGDASAIEFAWVWLCLVVELLAIADAGFLYVTFLRRADRRAEADRHEQRLRALPVDGLPAVDLFIPTLNEPPEVLEKTIVGALSLDYPKVKVWVLDDGRRPWLKDFCTERGVGYITRPDGTDAKAGNINHALAHTTGDFVAIFDADFIPQRNFLMRTLGFFDDPRIGIVQVPHVFYNHDPMQANLALRKTLPDDQRFFFDAIMPSRDAWDAAFCCGSNSVIRRSALAAIGGRLPHGSITEDMLLTLALLRQGYVTRFLAERLAVGLAPESIRAFFVQRQRWARGAIQILYLPSGPFGPGLKLIHRLMFLPTHWVTQSLTQTFALGVPIVFLWTGLAPFIHVTGQEILFYQLPAVAALIGGIRYFARRQYFPMASVVLSTFQSFKLLPSVLGTLIRPHGHVFRVTPKGSDARGAGYDRFVLWSAVTLMLLTVGGVAINASGDLRIVSQPSLIPMVALWSLVNVIVLLLVATMCLQQNARRGEERFAVDEAAWATTPNGSRVVCRLQDLSLSGAGVRVAGGHAQAIVTGERWRLYIDGVGVLEAEVKRNVGSLVGLNFRLPPSPERDLLIRKIFTCGLDNSVVESDTWSVVAGLLRRVFLPMPPVLGAAAVDMPAPAGKLPAETLVLQPRSAEPCPTLPQTRRQVRA